VERLVCQRRQAVYVIRNIVAPSPNHFCSGNTTTHCVCCCCCCWAVCHCQTC